MQIRASLNDPQLFDGDLLVLGRAANAAPDALEISLDALLGGALSKAAARLLFKGKAGQKVALDVLGASLPFGRLLLLGLGESTPAQLRDFAAAGANEALALRLGRVGFVAPGAAQIALGARLGAYRYDALKSVDPESPRAAIEEAVIFGDEAEVARGVALADAVCDARELANEPPNVCTPQRLADYAAAIAEGVEEMEISVLDKAAIYAKGMGGLIAVSRGATREPRFIHLKYTPKGQEAVAPLVFVGKGLTFDSGGLSLKPSPSMTEMHMDMAGAAATLGAMAAIAKLKPNTPVHMVVGACENMPDGDSYRVSDVLTMYSGKTVEILNTDAEGRLVLADALHYAATEITPKPRGVLDLATLTGACVVALGHHYTGLFSDDDALADAVLAAANEAGELMWRLPLDPKIGKELESSRADLKNVGGRWGGAISAALFLQHFKGELPWVHLDIAGPAMSEKNDGYVRVGGTGHGVLTLVALAEALAVAPEVKPEPEPKPKKPKAPKAPKAEAEAEPKKPKAPKAEAEPKPKKPKAPKAEAEPKPKKPKK
ncbi:leucyl aminopeptidase, partial [Myxococcota bacterium]|nr:leucyl aminopeptidase [Myxococcota bacterium]